MQSTRCSAEPQRSSVGIGQTPFYKRGTCGQAALKLALQAIVSACEDAGIDPADIDGFVSYGAERNDGQRMMPALNTKELRFGALVWTHGGGIPGALGLAATAIVTGQANVVAVSGQCQKPADNACVLLSPRTIRLPSNWSTV
jgi:3-oxoacyl-[acyl-carrier-protein] synthase III